MAGTETIRLDVNDGTVEALGRLFGDGKATSASAIVTAPARAALAMFRRACDVNDRVEDFGS